MMLPGTNRITKTTANSCFQNSFSMLVFPNSKNDADDECDPHCQWQMLQNAGSLGSSFHQPNEGPAPE